jgi:hypothetical protein
MSRPDGAADPEPIEGYLDELLVSLRLPPRELRRMLTETESHLRESATLLERAGLTPAAAQVEAVRRFGTTTHVAAAAMAGRRSSGAIAITLAWGALTLGAVALVAVGISGALAGVANVTLGPRFVGGLPSTYPAALCRYFMSIHQSAVDCAQAATLENSNDAVVLRCAAGVLGMALLAASMWWRRRLPAAFSSRLRDGVVGAVAAMAFAAATVILGAQAGDIVVQHRSDGVGFYLSGAMASAAGLLVCAAVAFRRLKSVRLW